MIKNNNNNSNNSVQPSGAGKSGEGRIEIVIIIILRWKGCVATAEHRTHGVKILISLHHCQGLAPSPVCDATRNPTGNHAYPPPVCATVRSPQRSCPSNPGPSGTLVRSSRVLASTTFGTQTVLDVFYFPFGRCAYKRLQVDYLGKR